MLFEIKTRSIYVVLTACLNRDVHLFNFTLVNFKKK